MIREWCPWPESNQHSLRNSILSRARLPIPPQGPSRSRQIRGVTKRAEYSGREQGVNRLDPDDGVRRTDAAPAGSCARDLLTIGDGSTVARPRDTTRCPSEPSRDLNRHPIVDAGPFHRVDRARDCGDRSAHPGRRVVFRAGARHQTVPAVPRTALCVLLGDSAGIAGGLRRGTRRAATCGYRRFRDPAAGGCRECLARRLSRRGRMAILARSDRMHRRQRP